MENNSVAPQEQSQAPSPATAPEQSPNQAIFGSNSAVGAPVTDTETGATPFGSTTGVGTPIPIPNRQSDWETGAQNEHGPRPSRWEAWVETPLEQGARATSASPFAGALMRMFAEDQAKSGKMLSADDANKLYPGRPVPYTTPVDQGTALMEYNDRNRQQQLSEWAAQRPMTNMGRVISTASGFVGGLTDPLNFAIGTMSGGFAGLIAPEAAPLLLKVAAHYAANVGGFSATEAIQNLLEQKMGAKPRSAGDIVEGTLAPAAMMTGVGIALGALLRRGSNEALGTSETDIRGVKKTVASFEQDKIVPQLEDQRSVIAERKAGVTQPDPGGEKIRPTLLTSPLKDTPLYAAAHADGVPLTHEHGLGPGHQFTDSHEVANNGVSRSTETPGQIAETKLPEGSKLLNIDQSAAEDYASKDSVLKQIEEKTGIPLEDATKNGESLKEVITKLGDFAGADLGEGGKIPENILSQVQDVLKQGGYSGYEFMNEAGTARIAHAFDTTGMEVSKSYPANPKITPPLEDQAAAPTDNYQGGQGAPSAETNPGIEKTQRQSYSPEIEKLVHDFRKKNTIFDPHGPEEMANVQTDVERYKQQLSEMAKTSDTAQEALEELKKQEVQDTRLRDIAKRIAECASGGGV